MIRKFPECEGNCLNQGNYRTTLQELDEKSDEGLRSLHAGRREFESLIAHTIVEVI